MKFLKKILNRQAILGYLAAFGILLILIFLILDKIAMRLYTKQYAEIELPDIVEKSSSEAEKILKSQGFRMIIDKSEYHPILPESTVIFQKPAPYTKVKRGRRIYVHISAGEKQVTVPSVVGISERDAQFRFIEKGLEVGEIIYKVSNYPKDVVCEQELPPNSEVPENTKVGFTVSLGRSKTEYIVPNVIGQSLSEATLSIRREGLKVGQIRYEIHEDIIPQTVISQNPSAGKEVTPNYGIHLSVSQLRIESSEGDSSATNSGVSIDTGG